MEPENWHERLRAFSERCLDLAGFPSSPRNQAPYRVSNDVQRSLAHLAGFDGNYSRLLRALESGVLRVSIEDSTGGKLVLIADGSVKTRPTLPSGLYWGEFPNGCGLVTPVWAARSPTFWILHTATGTATSTIDLGTAEERCVYVGPMNRAMLVYDSVTAGNTSRLVAQYDIGAHAPQYFHTGERYIDFVNAGAAIDVAVITWE